MSEAIGSSKDYYHGTVLDAAEAIVREGFQVWRFDEKIAQWLDYGGNLGRGIYITCDWRTAVCFGPVLLRVGLRPGTLLLDVSVPGDSSIIRSLTREFGREVLRKPLWEAIPRNKKLTRSEFIALCRHHYHGAWEQKWPSDFRWRRKQERHMNQLDLLAKTLSRYGFHGFGEPNDENGLVVFAGDRLIVKEVVGEFLAGRKGRWLGTWDMTNQNCPKSLDRIRTELNDHGSERAKVLAEQVRDRGAS